MNLLSTLGRLPVGLVSCLMAASVAAQKSDDLAALVGDRTITVDQVDWLMDRKLADRQLSAEVRERMEAEVVEQLVEQLIVLEFLSQTDEEATDDEVRLTMDRIVEEAKRIDKTLKQILDEQNLTPHGLSENLRWQISWQRYTDRLLTDENLETFFERNRRKYDGTEIRVAHLLLKPGEDGEFASAVSRAEEIRNRLLAGDLSWEEAVQQFSTAPSADKAGDIGWLKFSGPMPREFTLAAYELEIDDVSEAVVTPFGVHLIRCLNVKPGAIHWYDADDSLRKDAIKFLFNKIVDQHRPKVSVRYTGRRAYIDPETGKLVGNENPDR